MSSGECLRIEVLGPIRVVDEDGCDRTPDGPLQRRLLALLVLRRGRVVSVDEAVEALWPRSLPQDPVGALHNHLSRLRRGMPEGLISSVGDGYRLEPSVIELDSDRLAAVLRDEADAGAGAEIDAELRRWRGPAFPELEELAAGRAEAARLEELRAEAREVRAQHRLDRGDTDGLIAELTELVDTDPLRERPRALLMEALATSGRRVEALRAYDDFRRLLSDELGIEPSPVLAAQHADLLDGGVAATGAVARRPAGWVPPGRLPVPLTSLVGRAALATEVASLAEQHRLITLVGPGGVGKTRLLLELGHRLGAEGGHVVLCELAGVDAGSAADAIAAALGIDPRPGVAPVQRIADVISDTEVVLLVDNCEHVLEAIAAAAEHLLTRCPHVRILATSRERLRVPGEQLAAVSPLAVDGAESAAVRLFVERARAVLADFRPDDADVACVVEVVRRLDGLPLAIELAAARLHTHDVREVAAGLDRRFALLSSGARTASRHASLGAAVSWSFGLLDDHLQDVFAALSAFAAPFTAADAAAICALDDVREELAHLVERSLVTRSTDGRFALLETLRAFGAEQLAATGRAESVGERHARHFVRWVERADAGILDPWRTFVADVDAAIADLRAALAWLLDHRAVESAGRLVVALLDYGIMRLRPDVLVWSEEVLAADPRDASPMASRLWVVAAYAAWMTGDVAETSARSARALDVAQRREEAPHGEVLTVRGSCELFAGRLTDAVEWYRRAAVAAADDPAQRLMAESSELLAAGYAGDPTVAERADALVRTVGTARTSYAAYVWYCAGEAVLTSDPALARARYVQALDLAASTGTSFVTGLAGASKASIDARVGDPAATAHEYRQLIDHWRRAGMWSTQWTMLRSIAGLLSRLGRSHDAAVLLGAVEGTAAGHRIFGADEVALRELEEHLRGELGGADYAAAAALGAVLDGDAAVEHALQAL